MKRTKDLWIGNSKVLQTSKSQSILEGVIRCVSQDKNERIETTPKKVNHILNTPNIYKLLDKSPMYHNKMKRLKNSSSSREIKGGGGKISIPFPLAQKIPHKEKENEQQQQHRPPKPSIRVPRCDESSLATFYCLDSYNKSAVKLKALHNDFFWEDLLLLEDKVITLISDIKVKNYIINDCIEWWNCFIVSPLYTNTTYRTSYKNKSLDNIEDTFRNIGSILMYTIMLCYYTAILRSFGFTDYDTQLLDLMLYHHRLYLVVCQYFLFSTERAFVSKEDEEIMNKLTKQIKNYIKYEGKSSTIIEVVKSDLNEYYTYINKLCGTIVKKYSTYPKVSNFDTNALLNLYGQLKHKYVVDINDFFLNHFLRRFLGGQKNEFSFFTKQLPYPYLKNKCLKKFTLVLDLDETLIHYSKEIQIGNNILKKGTVQYRPGLFEFFESVSQFFELIVFTVGIAEYANPIIDSMETNGKIFSSRLYRDHAIIHQNDYVKDISRIGRDLSRIIIVDDKPFNFCLQKENGIAIKPYYGKKEESNDLSLINLIPILLKITREYSGDVRIGIKKNKVDIVSKVSSNMYRNKAYK